MSQPETVFGALKSPGSHLRDEAEAEPLRAWCCVCGRELNPERLMDQHHSEGELCVGSMMPAKFNKRIIK